MTTARSVRVVTRIGAAAALGACTLAALPAGAHAQRRSEAAGEPRRIIVNRTPLDARGWRVIEQLEAHAGRRLADGHYWYDSWSGAAGRWGGPAATLLIPGLPLGGRLPADASGGGDGRLTGVFVNGRELHPHDVRALVAINGQVWPGRWWVNGLGDFGPEGGPPIGNLRRAAERTRGGSWLRGGSGSTGFWTGGDGHGYVWAMDGYSGCSYASDGGGVIC